jgi:hypothetical protein
MAIFERRASQPIREESQRLQCIITVAVGLPTEQTYVPGDWIVLLVHPSQQFMFYTDEQFRQKYRPVDAAGEQLLVAEYDVVCDEEHPTVAVSEVCIGKRYYVVRRPANRFTVGVAVRGTLTDITSDSLILQDSQDTRHTVETATIAYIIQLKPDL